MGATIAYGESVIHEAESGETCTLNTEGEYLAHDIVIAVDEGGDLPSADGEDF